MLFQSKRRRVPGWAGVCAGTGAGLLAIAFAYGAQTLFESTEIQKPNPGRVTVDQSIQKIAEKHLREGLDQFGAKAGFAIVADPKTGRVLAVANIDTSKKRHPSEYWALSQVMEPASFVKALVAAEAIEEGLTSPQESHNCENGTYRYAGRTYHDWKKGGWEQLTTEETVANSSDICAMKIGEKLGIDGLKRMLVKFGFGPEGTARSFPSARIGNIALSDDAGVVPAVSAGYGFQATPLELIQAFGAVANGGKLLMPKPADSPSAMQPEVIRQVLSLENAQKVKEILRQVMLKGTAAQNKNQSKWYTFAGKTATSYVPDLTEWDLIEGKKKGNFAGFIGFGPVADPRIAIYVGVRDPKDETGAHGSAQAAPIFKNIADEVLSFLNVAPDKT